MPTHHHHSHERSGEFTIHDHHFLKEDETIARNTRKAMMVSVLTLLMMGVELLFGYLSSSMALLAEGWHMASHAGVLIITYFAYRLAKSKKLNETFSFGAGKFIPLGGYTNAMILALVAGFLALESAQRFFSPETVQFHEAILVASIGLLVNVVSAFVLGHGNHMHGADFHHSHEHEGDHAAEHDAHDHSDHDCQHPRRKADINIRSAYLHILADTLTTVFTILALLAGNYFHAPRLDSMMGFAGSLVILNWAYRLVKDTVWELLDGHSKDVTSHQIKTLLEDAETEILDLHVWRIAPHINAGEIIIASRKLKGGRHYRDKVSAKLPIQHLIVEEIPLVDD